MVKQDQTCVGGKAERANLAKRDKEICSAIGPILKSRDRCLLALMS